MMHKCTCVFTCVGEVGVHKPLHTCGGQRTTFGRWPSSNLFTTASPWCCKGRLAGPRASRDSLIALISPFPSPCMNMLGLPKNELCGVRGPQLRPSGLLGKYFFIH